MNRVSLQKELADAIDSARLVVKASKGLRDAVRLGVYLVGKRVFVASDANSAYELKDGKFSTLTADEYQKYIRPEHAAVMSFEFNGVPVEALNTLLGFFRELGG